MRYYELQYEPEFPEYPAKREHPRRIARLYALLDEWSDLKALCDAHDAMVIESRPGPVPPTLCVEALCPSPDAVGDLMGAWLDYIDTSPHRPRTDAERDAFNLRHSPFKHLIATRPDAPDAA